MFLVFEDELGILNYGMLVRRDSDSDTTYPDSEKILNVMFPERYIRRKSTILVYLFIK